MGAHNIDSAARAATRHRVTSAVALPEAGVFMAAQLRVYVRTTRWSVTWQLPQVRAVTKLVSPRWDTEILPLMSPIYRFGLFLLRFTRSKECIKTKMSTVVVSEPRIKQQWSWVGHLSIWVSDKSSIFKFNFHDQDYPQDVRVAGSGGCADLTWWWTLDTVDNEIKSAVRRSNWLIRLHFHVIYILCSLD